ARVAEKRELAALMAQKAQEPPNPFGFITATRSPEQDWPVSLFIPAHPKMLGDAALPGGRQTRPGSSQRSGQRRAPKKRRPRGRDIESQRRSGRAGRAEGIGKLLG